MPRSSLQHTTCTYARCIERDVHLIPPKPLANGRSATLAIHAPVQPLKTTAQTHHHLHRHHLDMHRVLYWQVPKKNLRPPRPRLLTTPKLHLLRLCDSYERSSP